MRANASWTIPLPYELIFGNDDSSGVRLKQTAANELTINGVVIASALAITGITSLTGLLTIGPEKHTLTAIPENGAIAPGTAANYIITKAGVAAMTLAAPTATTHDGQIIRVSSATANAHTITATGLFQTGAAAVDLATFANVAGAGLELMAYQGKWIVLRSVGVTFS